MSAVLDPYALYDAENWGEIDPTKQYVMEAVEVFEIGTHKGDVYTGRDLNTIVRNFRRFYFCDPRPLLVPPAVIGHEEDQKVLARTDIPAGGWVKNCWVQNTKLFLNIGNIPALVMKWIVAGLIKTVSAEIYLDSGEAGLTAGFGPTLRRVALIGGDIPQVKSLGVLPRPVPEKDPVVFFTEKNQKRWFLTNKLPPAGRLRYFAESRINEATDMAPKMFDELKNAGLDDDMAKKMAEYCSDPAKMKAMADMFGKAAPAPATAGGAGGFDRAKCIEFLSQKHGIDRVALDAKSDEELQAMMGNSMSDPSQAQMTDDNDEDDKDPEKMSDDPTKLTAKTTDDQQDELDKTGTSLPTAGVAIKQSEKAKVKKMSETAVISEIRQMHSESAARFNAFRKQLAAQQARELVAAEKRKGDRVKKFCEDAIKAGKIAPAELDAGLRAQLLRADDSRLLKFSEAGREFEGTELDMQIAAIESRPQLAIFSERMPTHDEKAAQQSRVEQILKHTESGRAVLAASRK